MQWTKKHSKIALIVGGVLAALLLALQLLKATIDPQAAIEPLRDAVKQLTGQPLITEQVSLGLFPSPHLLVKGVAIRSPLETRQPYLLYADSLQIALGWSALWAEKPAASHLAFDGLKLYFEKRRDGSESWYFLQAVRQQAQFSGEMTLQLSRAAFSYADLQDNTELRVDAINGQLGINALGVQASLNAQIIGQPVALSGDCTVARFVHLSDYDALCSATVNADGLQSTADYRLLQTAQSGLQARGTLKMQTQDARLWGDALFSQQEKRLQQSLSAPLPMTLEAETYSTPARLIVNASRLQVANSQGTLSVDYSSEEASQRQSLKVTAALEQLDFDQFKSLASVTATQRKNVFAGVNAISPNLDGTLRVSARQVHYNGLAMMGVQASGRFENGQITLDSAFGALPEHGQFSMLGRIISSEAGLQYEGSVEASGKALWAIAPLVGTQASSAARTELGSFRTRFNCSIAPSSSVISELRLLIGDNVRIAGGLNWQTQSRPAQLTGSLSLENADLRPFYEEWRRGASLYDAAAENPAEPFAFNWLTRPAFDVNLPLQLVNVQLPFDAQASGRGQLKRENQKLALESVNMQLGTMRAAGEASIRKASESQRPEVNIALQFSQLDMGNWLRSAMWRAPTEKPDAASPSVWSKRPFNFNPLRHFDGSLKLSAAKVNHDAFDADNMQFDAQMKDGLLQIERWAMQLWDGSFSGSGALDLRTLPTLDLRYRHDNASLQPLMRTFFGQEALSGRVSLAHTLKSSGVNFDEWMRNLGGALRFDASNVIARNFNLARLIQLIGSARSVSELPNIIRQVEAGGSSRIDRVQGVLHYADAKLQTTQITLGSRGVSGQMLVLADLIAWRIDSSIQLSFDQLQSAGGSPQLRIRYEGALNDAERSLNLKSIEAYLTQKQR